MAITVADIQQKTAELTAPEAPFELAEITHCNASVLAYKNAQSTLVELLQAGRAHGDADFIVYEGERLSYNDFYAKVDQFATALQQHYGIVAGDRVAIALRNAPDWAIAMAAAGLLGAVVVPLNSWGKTEELAYGVSDCGARLLVCDPPRLALIEHKLDELSLDVIVALSSEAASHPRAKLFSDVLAMAKDHHYQLGEVRPEDIALILYTSGSTGFPKGVSCTHRGVCQALMNMYFVGLLTMSLEGAREYRGGAERETPLLTIPLFHATGLMSGLLMPLQMGQKVVMMYKWDTEKALQLIESEKVTGLTSVPAVLQTLMSSPHYENYNTSSLFRVTAAGAATPTGLPELIESKIGNSSRSTGWGMTETMAVGSIMSGGVYDLKPASAGVKSPVMQLRFMDDSGVELPIGEAGEIQCRGVTVCAGYWNKPDATADIIDDGWMKTGDIGRLDEDGFLHITGRIKEIVIRGGENIYPGEVENAAYEWDMVQENVVFGVPDAAMGEEMAMIVYPRGGQALTEVELRAHLKERLAGFKVPKYIRVVDQPLPQNASGKLFKRKLQDEFIAQMQGD